jgi:hypothetical protein
MEVEKLTILHFPGTDDETEEFREFLVRATAHTKYENMYILITKKNFDTHFVEHDVMEKLKNKLGEKKDEDQTPLS